MKRTIILAITIIGLGISFAVVYFVYAIQNNPWYGLSCEEMFEFAMSPAHQELTMEGHMEFHKNYEPCLQNNEP